MLLAASFAGGPVLAQPATQPKTNGTTDLKGRTIEEVRIIGNNTVSNATIRNLIRTREGDKFDPATVEEDYQRVVGLRKFANVLPKAEPTATGVIVIFEVIEQKQLRNVVFKGNVAVDEATLREITDIKPGQ